MSDPVLMTYRGRTYPDFLRRGGASRYITPIAKQFCSGVGIDVGCGAWPLEGARGIDLATGGDAYDLPEPPELAQRIIGGWDYVFSSHCLEHLADPVKALEHWIARVRPGGTVFLYLPHPDMEYWLPQNCRKHLHSWAPREMADLLFDLGLVDVIHSERDLAWSFAVMGLRPERDSFRTTHHD